MALSLRFAIDMLRLQTVKSFNLLYTIQCRRCNHFHKRRFTRLSLHRRNSEHHDVVCENCGTLMFAFDNHSHRSLASRATLTAEEIRGGMGKDDIDFTSTTARRSDRHLAFDAMIVAEPVKRNGGKMPSTAVPLSNRITCSDTIHTTEDVLDRRTGSAQSEQIAHFSNQPMLMDPQIRENSRIASLEEPNSPTPVHDPLTSTPKKESFHSKSALRNASRFVRGKARQKRRQIIRLGQRLRNSWNKNPKVVQVDPCDQTDQKDNDSHSQARKFRTVKAAKDGHCILCGQPAAYKGAIFSDSTDSHFNSDDKPPRPRPTNNGEYSQSRLRVYHPGLTARDRRSVSVDLGAFCRRFERASLQYESESTSQSQHHSPPARSTFSTNISGIGTHFSFSEGDILSSNGSGSLVISNHFRTDSSSLSSLSRVYPSFVANHEDPPTHHRSNLEGLPLRRRSDIVAQFLVTVANPGTSSNGDHVSQSPTLRSYHSNTPDGRREGCNHVAGSDLEGSQAGDEIRIRGEAEQPNGIINRPRQLIFGSTIPLGGLVCDEALYDDVSDESTDSASGVGQHYSISTATPRRRRQTYPPDRSTEPSPNPSPSASPSAAPDLPVL
jgi:hypothetical protein